MATNNISIGQKIKSIRRRKGYTQAKLAESIGRSSTYVSYIESGFKSMSLETFVLIANALNATADEILEDSLENTVKVSKISSAVAFNALAISTKVSRLMLLKPLSM